MGDSRVVLAQNIAIRSILHVPCPPAQRVMMHRLGLHAVMRNPCVKRSSSTGPVHCGVGTLNGLFAPPIEHP
eukprot:2492-Eustigmatos_ZCMA.PRE.1